MQTAGNRASQKATVQKSYATKVVPPMLSMPIAASPTNMLPVHNAQAIAPGSVPLTDQQIGRIAHAIYRLDRYFQLPDGPRSFAIFMIALVLVVAGMVVQVLLSAQILQAQARLHSIQSEYQVLQQENSEFIWQIARETNLQKVRTRVADLGYQPATDYSYVVLPGVQNEAITSPEAATATVADPMLVPSEHTTQLQNVEQAAVTSTADRDSVLPIDTTETASAIQTDPPIDGWLQLLSTQPAGPVSDHSESLQQPPLQWWRNTWATSRDRAETTVQSVEEMLSKWQVIFAR